MGGRISLKEKKLILIKSERTRMSLIVCQNVKIRKIEL